MLTDSKIRAAQPSQNPVSSPMHKVLYLTVSPVALSYGIFAMSSAAKKSAWLLALIRWSRWRKPRKKRDAARNLLASGVCPFPAP
ncbi:Mobile element protein [Salmonella bongori]|nr:Mobile element protein [Salmonella bongori]